MLLERCEPASRRRGSATRGQSRSRGSRQPMSSTASPSCPHGWMRPIGRRERPDAADILKRLMKRILASLLTMVALAACASPLAKAETPEQALGAAAQRASQLHSAKFDLTGNVKMTFPPQLGAMFGQRGTSAGSLALDMTGNGEAQFPDRYHATINAKLAGLSVATEVVVANGKAYVKNPMTGKWESSAQGGLTGQLSQPDPLSYEQLLRNVKTINPQSDTTLQNTPVHHYQLIPDKDKLIASFDKAAVKNPQAKAAIEQVLNSGTMTVDVWFGKDDHLVRRVTTDADYTVDLSQLMGALGAPSSSSSRVPAGSTFHATAHIEIDYHDFDAPVNISITTLG